MHKFLYFEETGKTLWGDGNADCVVGKISTVDNGSAFTFTSLPHKTKIRTAE